jgi:hypothetical protein
MWPHFEQVLESVTLDLYVTRIILKTLSLYPKIRDSCLAFLGVVDAWGLRYVCMLYLCTLTDVFPVRTVLSFVGATLSAARLINSSCCMTHASFSCSQHCTAAYTLYATELYTQLFTALYHYTTTCMHECAGF